MWQQSCLPYELNTLVVPLDHKLRRNSNSILARRLIIYRNPAKDCRLYLAYRVKASGEVNIDRYIVLLSLISQANIVESDIDSASG